MKLKSYEKWERDYGKVAEGKDQSLSPEEIFAIQNKEKLNLDNSEYELYQWCLTKAKANNGVSEEN